MVAAQLTLNLVEPQSSGIGGGAFMLYWDAKTRRLSTFDGRETAPMAAGPDLFLKADGTAMSFDEAVPGGRSVGVPGTLALLELAHRLHGKLPWADLVSAGGRTRRPGLRDLAPAGRSHRRQRSELRGVRHDASLFPGRRRQPARGRHHAA